MSAVLAQPIAALPLAEKLNVAKTQLESWPLARETITSGNPAASGLVFSKSADGTCVRGIWACTPGSFRWTWTDEEMVTIVAGRATVAMDDGRRVELTPGDMAFFEAGQSSEWTIHEPFRKSFHTRTPSAR